MSDDIGKLADEVISRRKTTEELKHVPFEMYARVLARAERADARIAELEAQLKRYTRPPAPHSTKPEPPRNASGWPGEDM